MSRHTEFGGSLRRGARASAGVVCVSVALVATLSGQRAAGTGPRVPPVPGEQRTPEQKALVEQFAPLGMPNFVATYVSYPLLTQQLMPHVRYLTRESSLSARHRALLSLRTAWLTRSAYLWGHLVPLAREAKLSDDEMTRVARGPDTAGWDPFEAALIRSADEHHIDSFMSDATWTTLATQYDLPKLIDTIDTAGALTMHAGVINSLGIDVEADVKDRLPSVPFSIAAKRTNLRLEGKGARIPPVEAQPGGRQRTAFAAR
jgi:4-carboxymuconolactone decarboxylase